MANELERIYWIHNKFVYCFILGRHYLRNEKSNRSPIFVFPQAVIKTFTLLYSVQIGSNGNFIICKAENNFMLFKTRNFKFSSSISANVIDLPGNNASSRYFPTFRKDRNFSNFIEFELRVLFKQLKLNLELCEYTLLETTMCVVEVLLVKTLIKSCLIKEKVFAILIFVCALYSDCIAFAIVWIWELFRCNDQVTDHNYSCTGTVYVFEINVNY